jgi:outer membrane protein OmpA-like peptidoglycan-associated protein
LRLTGEVGMQFHPKMELSNLTGANSLVTGLSFSGYVGKKMGLVGEIRASTPVKKSVVSGSVAHTEMIGSARWGRGTGRAMIAGFGSALSGGAGLPAWRLFLGGAFGRRTDAPLMEAERQDSEPICPDGTAPVVGRTLAVGCYAPLTVVARYQERTMAADYIVRTHGGENRAFSDANGWRTKGLPGDTWVVQAIAQSCLTGSASITVSDHGGWIDVPLEPDRNATVTLHIEDDQGEPLSGAQVEWSGGHPDCFAHPNPSALDGTLPVSLPEGQWGATIRKGGYAPVTRSVTVVAGEQDVLRVQLQPVPLWMETGRIVLYEPLSFGEQTATLAESSLVVVNALAELLKAQPEVLAIRIDAHTHDRGTDEENLALSQRRADTVRDALIDRGIEAERMETRGIGEAEPIAPNRTALGRSRNERVEIQVLETEGERR